MRRMAESKYEKGDEFNWLTLDRMEKVGSHRFWVCKCQCGKETKQREDRVVSGEIKSCGCYKKKKQKENHHLWKGVGELSGQTYSYIRCHSIRREIKFDVTIEFLWELFVKQEGKCALTGLPINFQTLTERQNGGDQSASLDRIDSDGGYVPGNVQWVHKDVNKMKNEYPMERFVELCRLVTENHQPALAF